MPASTECLPSELQPSSAKAHLPPIGPVLLTEYHSMAQPEQGQYAGLLLLAGLLHQQQERLHVSGPLLLTLLA